MKKSFPLFAVLLAGLFCSPAALYAVPVNSTIQNVTIFSDRALITRSAAVTLVPGDQTFTFSSLTGSMDPGSVQIKGTGPAVIKGVQVEPIHLAEGQDEDLNTLLRELEDVSNQYTATTDRIEHARQEKTFIEAIAKRLTTATEKSEQAELDPKKWIDMVDFYRIKLDKLDTEIRTQNTVAKTLRDKQNKLNRDINELRGRIQFTQYKVHVVLTATAAGAGQLEMSYLVFGPNWQPQYDIRADSKTGTLQVLYQANIRQNTGEDWRHARLTLSTAQPQAGDKHPDLQAWRIQPALSEPPVVEAKKTHKKKAYLKTRAEAESSLDAASLAAVPQPQMAPITAVAQTGGTAVQFEIKGQHTIRSDNQPHQVTIMVKDYPATYLYSSAPKLVQQAFLKAEITNDTDFPLLAGETNVFLDNNFVTSGSINTVAPSETFWTFLGIDEGIKVEYKLINREQSRPGMFGGKIKVVFDYKILVTNHKKKAYDMVIQDQLPLPADRDIQVELISPTYRANDPSFTKNSENLLEWKKTLAPGESVEIPFKFSVTYPESMQIEGL